jgi:hypothetical protein
MEHNFADGKYTVINDNGKLTALRYGEAWGRDLCGDNLIYWMLTDFDAMKEHRDELLEALEIMTNIAEMYVKPEFVTMARSVISKTTGEA